jgi:hypothetical protein
MNPVVGQSTSSIVPGVLGENTANGDAVFGQASSGGRGVVGVSDSHTGVEGNSKTGTGIWGSSTTGMGVFGVSNGGGRGVVGVSDSHTGTEGNSTSGTGVWGSSTTGPGVNGISTAGDGVQGHSSSATGRGVFGENTAGGDAVFGIGNNGGRGVVGVSNDHTGVEGSSDSGTGVWGSSTSGRGVNGISTSGDGVFGQASSGGRGVVGVSDSHTGTEGNSTSGTGVWGSSTTGTGVYGKGGAFAGYFEGNVAVTGDIFLTGADCAEEFDIAEAASIEPGTVVVLGQGGTLQQCQQAYDKKVAGVISGAGDYRPGMIFDRHQSQNNRMPVALVGKVYCKVDARYAPIEVGDMLTTSPTPGHAMKAGDPLEAFGSVMGKALHPLRDGQGLIPILIALQ